VGHLLGLDTHDLRTFGDAVMLSPGRTRSTEPGLSFLIETAGKKILFDTGYSDLFLANAEKMGIDLRELDFIVLSHGHLDHSG
jgi:metal-dependent hydrolase (beta-lactamase superfamily II)